MPVTASGNRNIVRKKKVREQSASLGVGASAKVAQKTPQPAALPKPVVRPTPSAMIADYNKAYRSKTGLSPSPAKVWDYQVQLAKGMPAPKNAQEWDDYLMPAAVSWAKFHSDFQFQLARNKVDEAARIAAMSHSEFWGDYIARPGEVVTDTHPNAMRPGASRVDTVEVGTEPKTVTPWASSILRNTFGVFLPGARELSHIDDKTVYPHVKKAAGIISELSGSSERKFRNVMVARMREAGSTDASQLTTQQLANILVFGNYLKPALSGDEKAWLMVQSTGLVPPGQTASEWASKFPTDKLKQEVYFWSLVGRDERQSQSAFNLSYAKDSKWAPAFLADLKESPADIAYRIVTTAMSEPVLLLEADQKIIQNALKAKPGQSKIAAAASNAISDIVGLAMGGTATAVAAPFTYGLHGGSAVLWAELNKDTERPPQGRPLPRPDEPRLSTEQKASLLKSYLGANLVDSEDVQRAWAKLGAIDRLRMAWGETEGVHPMDMVCDELGLDSIPVLGEILRFSSKLALDVGIGALLDIPTRAAVKGGWDTVSRKVMPQNALPQLIAHTNDRLTIHEMLKGQNIIIPDDELVGHLDMLSVTTDQAIIGRWLEPLSAAFGIDSRQINLNTPSANAWASYKKYTDESIPVRNRSLFLPVENTGVVLFNGRMPTTFFNHATHAGLGLAEARWWANRAYDVLGKNQVERSSAGMELVRQFDNRVKEVYSEYPSSEVFAKRQHEKSVEEARQRAQETGEEYVAPERGSYTLWDELVDYRDRHSGTPKERLPMQQVYLPDALGGEGSRGIRKAVVEGVAADAVARLAEISAELPPPVKTKRTTTVVDKSGRRTTRTNRVTTREVNGVPIDASAAALIAYLNEIGIPTVGSHSSILTDHSARHPSRREKGYIETPIDQEAVLRAPAEKLGFKVERLSPTEEGQLGLKPERGKTAGAPATRTGEVNSAVDLWRLIKRGGGIFVRRKADPRVPGQVVDPYWDSRLSGRENRRNFAYLDTTDRNARDINNWARDIAEEFPELGIQSADDLFEWLSDYENVKRGEAAVSLDAYERHMRSAPEEWELAEEARQGQPAAEGAAPATAEDTLVVTNPYHGAKAQALWRRLAVELSVRKTLSSENWRDISERVPAVEQQLGNHGVWSVDDRTLGIFNGGTAMRTYMSEAEATWMARVSALENPVLSWGEIVNTHFDKWFAGRKGRQADVVQEHGLDQWTSLRKKMVLARVATVLNIVMADEYLRSVVESNLGWKQTAAMFNKRLHENPEWSGVSKELAREFGSDPFMSEQFLKSLVNTMQSRIKRGTWTSIPHGDPRFWKAARTFNETFNAVESETVRRWLDIYDRALEQGLGGDELGRVVHEEWWKHVATDPYYADPAQAGYQMLDQTGRHPEYGTTQSRPLAAFIDLIHDTSFRLMGHEVSAHHLRTGKPVRGWQADLSIDAVKANYPEGKIIEDIYGTYDRATKGIADLVPNRKASAALSKVMHPYDTVLGTLGVMGTRLKRSTYANFYDQSYRMIAKRNPGLSAEEVADMAHQTALHNTERSSYMMTHTLIEEKLRNVVMFLPAYRQFFQYWAPKAGKNFWKSVAVLSNFDETPDIPTWFPVVGPLSWATQNIGFFGQMGDPRRVLPPLAFPITDPLQIAAVMGSDTAGSLYEAISGMPNAGYVPYGDIIDDLLWSISDGRYSWHSLSKGLFGKTPEAAQSVAERKDKVIIGHLIGQFLESRSVDVGKARGKARWSYAIRAGLKEFIPGNIKVQLPNVKGPAGNISLEELGTVQRAYLSAQGEVERGAILKQHKWYAPIAKAYRLLHLGDINAYYKHLSENDWVVPFVVQRTQYPEMDADMPVLYEDRKDLAERLSPEEVAKNIEEKYDNVRQWRLLTSYNTGLATVEKSALADPRLAGLKKGSAGYATVYKKVLSDAERAYKADFRKTHAGELKGILGAQKAQGDWLSRIQISSGNPAGWGGIYQAIKRLESSGLPGSLDFARASDYYPLYAKAKAEAERKRVDLGLEFAAMRDKSKVIGQTSEVQLEPGGPKLPKSVAMLQAAGLTESDTLDEGLIAYIRVNGTWQSLVEKVRAKYEAGTAEYSDVQRVSQARQSFLRIASGTSGKDPQRQVVKVARTFLGVPYYYGSFQSGVDPHKGVDCSGLVKAVYNACGKPDFPTYTGNQYPKGTQVGSSASGAEGLQAADLIFFGSKPYHHVAIYIGNGKVIHAPQTGQVVSEVPLSHFAGKSWDAYRYEFPQPKLVGKVRESAGVNAEAREVLSMSASDYLKHIGADKPRFESAFDGSGKTVPAAAIEARWQRAKPHVDGLLRKAAKEVLPDLTAQLKGGKRDETQKVVDALLGSKLFTQGGMTQANSEEMLRSFSWDATLQLTGMFRASLKQLGEVDDAGWKRIRTATGLIFNKLLRPNGSWVSQTFAAEWQRADKAFNGKLLEVLIDPLR